MAGGLRLVRSRFGPLENPQPSPTMKFSQLLQQRDLLLRQARLANVAFAYEWLRTFLFRASRAGLRGAFLLRDGDPEDGLPWPTLVAIDASQAVLEEHFLEADIVELADILAYLNDGGRPPEREFRLEELADDLLPALRRELEEGGVPPQGLPASPENAEAGE